MQLSPVRALVALARMVSAPARLAMRRSTSNEPLGGWVVRLPANTCTPLSVIRTDQVWPLRFESTSNSTSRRPSSGLALSFQSEAPVQEPRRMTSPSLAEAGPAAMPPTSMAAAAPAMPRRAGSRWVMVWLLLVGEVRRVEAHCPARPVAAGSGRWYYDRASHDRGDDESVRGRR